MTLSEKESLAGSVRKEEVWKLCEELVANPSHVGIEDRERGVALALKEYLEDTNCLLELQEVEEGRPNFLAVLPAKGAAPPFTKEDPLRGGLTLNGHMDTVPPAGMEEPYAPVRREGKIFGRGIADMKGALGAMAVAMKTIADSGIELEKNLILAGVVGEETGSPGMVRLLESERWLPEFCLVGEPTELKLGMAHKGIEWLKIETKGEPAHASTPDLGVNAIDHMAKLINRLNEKMAPLLQGRSHPLLGHPTFNIGKIEGGEESNIVAPSCQIDVDRRWLPQESVESLMGEFQEVIDELEDELEGFRAKITRGPLSKVKHGPFEGDKEGRLAESLRQAIGLHRGEEPEEIGLDFWTDGALAQDAGIETLIFGPGSGDQAHTKEEYASMEQLVEAAEIYCRLGLDLCS